MNQIPKLSDDEVLAVWQMYQHVEPGLPDSDLLEMVAAYLHCCPSEVADTLARKGRP